MVKVTSPHPRRNKKEKEREETRALRDTSDAYADENETVLLIKMANDTEAKTIYFIINSRGTLTNGL